MGMFKAIDIAASGMTAERLRMDLIGNNIANVNTTRTEEGGPYKRQMAVFEPRSGGMNFGQVLAEQMDGGGTGVRVKSIEKDQSPPRMIYDPTHPDANEQGYVAYPDINPVIEMVDLIEAMRSYEANVSSFNTHKNIDSKTLDILNA